MGLFGKSQAQKDAETQGMKDRAKAAADKQYRADAAAQSGTPPTPPTPPAAPPAAPVQAEPAATPTATGPLAPFSNPRVPDGLKNYGMKSGGVIQKKLLKRKAAVQQKRGC